jgi:hypothetical protein
MITFLTNSGDSEVTLCRDMQNEDIAKVQVHDQKELNRLIKNKETVGKNCSLGGLTVYDAFK